MLIFLCLLPLTLSARYPDPPVFAAVQHYPSICYLPPDSGLCTTISSSEENSADLLTRFYFDSTTQQCYPFGVQGCGGNENRFKTQSDCQKYCQLDVR